MKVSWNWKKINNCDRVALVLALDGKRTKDVTSEHQSFCYDGITERKNELPMSFLRRTLRQFFCLRRPIATTNWS
jgi:hypothetical protein